MVLRWCYFRPPCCLIALPLPFIVSLLFVLTVTVALTMMSIPSTIEFEPLHKPITTQVPDLPKTTRNDTTLFQFHIQTKPKQNVTLNTAPPQLTNKYNISLDSAPSPYHDWEQFAADYHQMFHTLKFYVYPEVYTNESFPFARIFRPYTNLNPLNFDPKLGNYYSEHAFKAALLRSSFVSPHPERAHFFFMPFSINAMRNEPQLHSESSISDFVAQYAKRVSSQFQFWNASGGADHFYVCCHSVCREAASKHHELLNNAIQVTCSSSYFQRGYVAHKDVGLPQVWPRQQEPVLNPPHARKKLLFFSGRMQNSNIRKELMALWGNDSSMDIFSGNLPFPYEEGFRRSRYCLHVKGYEVNTARVSDAIHYGCIPVLISNYYDLPFANVLDWNKFSIIISPSDIAFLKSRLLSISRQAYLNMYRNVCIVRRHFRWHTTPPKRYDAFYMTAYQLWLRRGLHRLSFS